LLSGILLDYIVSSVTVAHAAHHTWMLPPVVKFTSAIILFAVLGFAIMQQRKADG
jgi:uncharacterized membrane protein SirB2